MKGWKILQGKPADKRLGVAIVLAMMTTILTMGTSIYEATFLAESEGRSTFMILGWVIPLITMVSLLYPMGWSLFGPSVLDDISAKLDIIIRNTGGYDGHGATQPKSVDSKKDDDKTE